MFVRYTTPERKVLVARKHVLNFKQYQVTKAQGKKQKLTKLII